MENEELKNEDEELNEEDEECCCGDCSCCPGHEEEEKDAENLDFKDTDESSSDEIK